MKALRFAQEIDQSARRFYEEMANRADNPGVEKIFHMLAQAEEDLLHRHLALAGRGNGMNAVTLDEEENVFEQLRRQEELLTVSDDIAAYRLALEAERKVVEQYRSASAAESRPEIKRILGEIAREETHHLEEIENLYDFANAPNQYLAWGEFSNIGEFHNFGRENT